MTTEIKEILTELKKPFPPEDHKERALRGGGKWFYIPWQKIRDRLDSVCPDWSVSYSDPVVCGEHIIIRCKITICGVSREAVGNDMAFVERNEKGNSKTIGTPPERAAADAFKNAAEEFGVAAYLDDQEYVIRYLHKKGDGRGVRYGVVEPSREKKAQTQPPKPTQSPQIIDRPTPETATRSPEKISSPSSEELAKVVGVTFYRLGYNYAQESEFIKQKFGVDNRKQLSTNQLIQLQNMLNENLVSNAN